MITIKGPQAILAMREAGHITAMTLERLEQAIKPGVTTGELDQLAGKIIREAGATPAFYKYRGYPGQICVSVNDVVIHGIGGIRRLKAGDIVSVDVGATYKGYHSDAARTFAVGDVGEENKRLIEVTKASFFEGLKYCREGNHLHDICLAIETYVEANGFTVVRDFTGHGIGTKLHEAPEIPNFKPKGRGPRLVAGMTLAIEPMVNAGGYEVRILDDEWTVVTEDGKNSAHYENTVLITEGEPEILTIRGAYE